MIAQRVSAIVLAPADSKALVPVAIKAQKAGIVVVNIDNRLDAGLLREQGVRIPFVGPDNRKGAAKVAAYVAASLKAGDPVAILEGAPNAFNGIERKAGFEEAVARAGLRVVASQTANWEAAQANQVAASMLAAHPDLTAIFCANDSMALGVAAALRAAGRAAHGRARRVRQHRRGEAAAGGRAARRDRAISTATNWRCSGSSTPSRF